MEEQKNNNTNETADKNVAPVTPTSASTSETQEEKHAMETVTEPEKKSMTGMILGVLLAGVVIAVGYVMLFNDGEIPFVDSTATDETEVRTITADQVIARVNGKEIYGATFMMQVSQLARSFAIEDINTANPTMREQIQTQALDAVINTALVVGAAEGRGITVSDEEVTAKYDELSAAIGGLEAAEARLESMGITTEQFRENLRNDLFIERYLVAVSGPDALAVSEEEVQTMYDELTGDAEGAPPLSEVRFQVEEQLRFQKLQTSLSEELKILRPNANIEILM